MQQTIFEKHEWYERDFRWTNNDTSRGILICCRKCGIIRQLDGRNDDKPCKSKVRVELRDSEG